MSSLAGRERELEEIAAFLDIDRDGARVLLLEGEAGIGKTTVWRAGVEQAKDRTYRVLACSAAGSEAQLSFTSLRDLVGDAFDDVADDLPGPQRRAMSVVLLREEASGPPPDPAAIAVAFFTTLRALAARAPTLLAIDDIQWLDPGSAMPLGYALRRLTSEPLAVILSRRPLGAAAGAPVLDLPADDRLHVLCLDPLSLGALGHILRERLGLAYPRPTLQRLHEVSGGNPFFALELARALGDPGRPLAPDATLPVPRTLKELVQNRLSELPDQTLEVLSFASAVSRPTVKGVRTAIGFDPLPALTPAIQAQVADVEGASIRFAHPLYAAAVYGIAPAALRRAIHRRLADVIDDVEERARHLALATDAPDAEVAAALEDAALRIRTRGAPLVCAELFEAAGRLTPDDDEPGRARRTLAAATALCEAGDTDRAIPMLERLVQSMPEGADRVEARWRLGMVLGDTSRYDDAMRVWREALDATNDPAAIADVRRGMAIMAIYGGKIDDAIEHAAQALTAAERCADVEHLANALGVRALVGVLTGDPSYPGFLDRALQLEPALDATQSMWSPSTVAAECARFALQIDEARVRFADVLERAIEGGNVELEWWATYGLARAELLGGDRHRATELSDAAFALANTVGRWRLPATTLRAELDGLAGRSAEAYAALRSVIAEAEPLGETRWLWQAHAVFGRTALGVGDPITAADELRSMRELAADTGMRHPSVLAALVDEVEAAAAADRSEQAGEASTAAERLGDRYPWGAPLLLRATAVLLMREGQAELAESTLERSLALQPASFLPLQRGRTLLMLGTVQRRSRRRRSARETLQRALAVFEGIGAATWATQVRAELGRIGGRAASIGDLTPAERRIAELVAEGKTNQEVATGLFLTVRTVEAALTRVYRKLEIRTRTELARRFAGPA